MSLTLNLIFASKAKSTHHMLALDALRHLRGAGAEKWRDLFLSYFANYLQGAKAPDDEFKDFKNHVLHVSDNFWGGAVNAAKNWYGHLLCELRAKNWSEAAYCAGVLSHYYTDPLMPFHTGQSEAEGAVHRAAEWSITKSYETLRDILIERLGGWPDVELTEGDNWLRDAMHAGAELAHAHYDFLIDHYNLDRGVKNPVAGLDEPSREILAQLLGYAAVGFGRVLEKAIAEAGVSAPAIKVGPQAFFSTLAAPMGAVAKKFSDQKERAQILAMYDEYVATGKCVITLPEDDRVVRANYAKEVLKVPLSQLDAEKSRKPGLQFGSGEAPRFVTIAKPMPKLAAAPKHAPLTKPSVSEGIATEPSLVAVTPAREQGELAAQESAVSESADAGVELAAAVGVPTRRSIKQMASQLHQKVTPKVKAAAAGVTSGVAMGVSSLVRKMKAKPKPAVNPEKSLTVNSSSEKSSGIKTTETTFFRSMLDRFTSKAKSDEQKWTKVGKSEKQDETGIDFQPAQRSVGQQAVKAPAVSPSDSTLKFYLDLSASVEDGPSIGPKMAARMAKIGVKSVNDFLRADPMQLGAKLGFNATASEKIKDWQDQARLVCRVPNLRGHDAQILVACGIREAKNLASSNAAALTKQAIEFARGSEGQRLLRGASMPDADEVRDWIAWAQSARSLKAA
jgi:hypothetical protein